MHDAHRSRRRSPRLASSTIAEDVDDGERGDDGAEDGGEGDGERKIGGGGALQGDGGEAEGEREWEANGEDDETAAAMGDEREPRGDDGEHSERGGEELGAISATRAGATRGVPVPKPAGDDDDGGDDLTSGGLDERLATGQAARVAGHHAALGAWNTHAGRGGQAHLGDAGHRGRSEFLEPAPARHEHVARRERGPDEAWRDFDMQGLMSGTGRPMCHQGND